MDRWHGRTLWVALALLGCSGKENEPLPSTGDAGTHPVDSSVDSGKPTDSSIDSGDTTATKPPPKDTGIEPFDTVPPPITDLGTEDFGTLPPSSFHVEAVIGPAGGTLSGKPGSELDQVTLVVPAGALAVATTIAIDLAIAPSPLPPGAKTAGIYVRVGPDATPFAVPARLTLPWFEPGSAPQVCMLARVGSNWSSLLDPSGTPKPITASMTRASGAVAAIVNLSSIAPKPTSFAPSSAAVGDVVFLDGGGFGVAPVWRPGVDGGLPFTSQVMVGSVAASPLAWSDTTISFRVPTGASSDTLSVITPGGTGTTTKTLTVP